ncbi:MAG: arginine--tRNA ligase [Bacteroidales bacterium]|jgi:arginyl-tRNA synthetase|nr:arginine--tRNA ligase [Bacteroidales bacterium]
MQGIETIISKAVVGAIEALYEAEVSVDAVQIQKTRKEFSGDVTVVAFPFLRHSRKGPEQTAEALGHYLVANVEAVQAFNVVKGFLNLEIAADYWLGMLNYMAENDDFAFTPESDDSPLVMVEYSSPNTNKPLHLGHIRNNLLGWSISEILKANGNKVVKTNIVNDRGIHICKSMLAWQKWGEGATPESTGKKGDHLIGDYYVKFDQEYKKEVAAAVANGVEKEEAEANSQLISEAREMLRQWEAKDETVYALWQKMNAWVYAGFDVTYKRLGVDFDKIYYESETYLEGKDKVLEGLENGAFYKRDDSSIWADMTVEGLDEKILLPTEGSSVYMTQDIGTAKLRFDDYPIDKMVYVVGNEQNYHFQVLSIILTKLGFKWGKDLKHFSYGMVELPEGKMKSREGTVVDADDLMDEMINSARSTSEELGKLEGYSTEETEEVYRKVGMSALKYFMLKVDPKKNMVFNPKESIDFNGNTGPFIQYTYARISSILRKAEEQGLVINAATASDLSISQEEIDLIKKMTQFAEAVAEAANIYSPAIIANYIYDLVKDFNRFYHGFSMLKEENEALKIFRIKMSASVAQIIERAMGLLGIEMPERM